MKFLNFIGIGIFLLIFLFIGVGVIPFEKFFGIDSFLVFFCIFIVVLAGMLIGVVVFTILKRRKPVIEVVEFSAPEGMTPADAGYLIDGKVDDRDISALLVYWAEKKYLEIEEKEDNVVILKKLKDPDDRMKAYEKAAFSAIFAGSDEVNIKQLAKLLQPISGGLSTQIKRDNNARYYDSKTKNWSSFFTIGSALLLVFISYFLGTGGNFSIFCGVVIFAISAIFAGVSSKVYVQKKIKSMVLYISGLVLFLVFAALNLVFAFNNLYVLLLIGVASIVTLVTFILCPLVEYRNVEGKKMLGRLLGLKKYIELAEKDKMEKLVKDNPDLYYQVLPYAYVLGVSDEWIDKFNFVKEINSKNRRDIALAVGVIGAAMLFGGAAEILGGLLGGSSKSSRKSKAKK